MPVFRRFGRPGLLGAVATTAVVAGTATMTARAVNNGMNRRAATQQEAAAYESEQAAAAAPQQVPVQQAAPAEGASLPEELQSLSDMHSRGVIDDAEFAAAKSRLLAS